MRRRPKNDPWADVRREARRTIRRRSWSRIMGTAGVCLAVIIVAALTAGATPHRIMHRFSAHSPKAVSARDFPTAVPSATATPSNRGGTPREGTASPSVAPTLFGLESAAAGDCLLWNPHGVATSMHEVSCGKSHRAEVTALVDVSDRFDTWPGQSALQKAVEQICPEALHRYAPSRPADPVVIGWGIMPLQQAWSSGDHRLVCTAESPTSGLMTGSVKSATPVVLSAG